MENTRPRIDGRVPVAPGSDSGAMVDLQPLSQEALEERYGAPAPDPEETVRVVDALTVEAELEDLLAGQLVAALNRAIVEIAPRLARPTDGGWMSERLYLALDDGWRRTELEWRERHPFDHARTGEDVGSE